MGLHSKPADRAAVERPCTCTCTCCAASSHAAPAPAPAPSQEDCLDCGFVHPSRSPRPFASSAARPGATVLCVDQADSACRVIYNGIFGTYGVFHGSACPDHERYRVLHKRDDRQRAADSPWYRGEL